MEARHGRAGRRHDALARLGAPVNAAADPLRTSRWVTFREQRAPGGRSATMHSSVRSVGLRLPDWGAGRFGSRVREPSLAVFCVPGNPEIL